MIPGLKSLTSMPSYISGHMVLAVYLYANYNVYFPIVIHYLTNGFTIYSQVIVIAVLLILFFLLPGRQIISGYITLTCMYRKYGRNVPGSKEF